MLNFTVGQDKMSISSFCIIMDSYFSLQIVSFLGSSLISSLLHCEVNPSLAVSLAGCHQRCSFIGVIARNPV